MRTTGGGALPCKSSYHLVFWAFAPFIILVFGPELYSGLWPPLLFWFLAPDLSVLISFRPFIIVGFPIQLDLSIPKHVLENRLHQRCKHCDSLFVKMYCYTAGSRNGWKVLDTVGAQTRKLGKESFFLFIKRAIPSLWDQTYAPDLLVLTMKS